MRVVIVVRGGAVQEVITDIDVEVSILDHDLFEGGAGAGELRDRKMWPSFGEAEVDAALEMWEQEVQKYLYKEKKA